MLVVVFAVVYCLLIVFEYCTLLIVGCWFWVGLSLVVGVFSFVGCVGVFSFVVGFFEIEFWCLVVVLCLSVLWCSCVLLCCC